MVLVIDEDQPTVLGTKQAQRHPTHVHGHGEGVHGALPLGVKVAPADAPDQLTIMGKAVFSSLRLGNVENGKHGVLLSHSLLFLAHL